MPALLLFLVFNFFTFNTQLNFEKFSNNLGHFNVYAQCEVGRCGDGGGGGEVGETGGGEPESGGQSEGGGPEGGSGGVQPTEEEHHDVSEESQVERIAEEGGVSNDTGAKEAIAYGEYEKAKKEADTACGSGDSEGCNYYSHLASIKEQEYGAYRDYHLSQQGGTRAETQAEQQATSAAEEAAYQELQRSGDFNKAVEAAISKGGGSLPSELRGALIGRIAKAAGVTPQQAIDKAIEVESQRSDATANSIAGAAAFASKASGQDVKEMMEASMKGAAAKDSSLKGQVAAGVAAANASGASKEEINRIAIQTAYEKYNASGLSTVQAEDELGQALAGLQISRQDLEKQLETLGAPHSFADSVGFAWEKFRQSSPVASYGFINFNVASREPIPLPDYRANQIRQDAINNTQGSEYDKALAAGKALLAAGAPAGQAAGAAADIVDQLTGKKDPEGAAKAAMEVMRQAGGSPEQIAQAGMSSLESRGYTPQQATYFVQKTMTDLGVSTTGINFDNLSSPPPQPQSNNAIESARNRLLELRDYALNQGVDSRVLSHLDKILQEGRITILSADELKRRASSFSSSLIPAGFYDSETDTIIISADYAEDLDLILHEAIHRSAYVSNPGHRDWIIKKFGINNASKLEEGVTEAVVVFGQEGRGVYDPEIAVIREEFVEAIQKNSSRSPEYSYAVILEAGLAGNFQRLAEEMGGGDLDKGIKTINEILDRTHKAWEFDVNDEH